jgi:hypothetical protein
LKGKTKVTLYAEGCFSGQSFNWQEMKSENLLIAHKKKSLNLVSRIVA